MRAKPALRLRRSGALLIVALIAFVGAVPLAGSGWEFAPVLLLPLIFGVWAWRAGTDVYPDRLRVRALVGSTEIPWSRVVALAPDPRGRVAAQLENGNAIALTGVTAANLPAVLAAAGHPLEPTGDRDRPAGGPVDYPSPVSSPPSPD